MAEKGTAAASKGLKPIGRIGLSDSDRGKGLPERTKPMYVETKKKDKPRTAAAGGGANPPKPPKKGPTGGDDKGPNKDPKKDKDDKKSMGGLTKSSRKEETKNPRNSFKERKK
jgi:hypothetical protein